jgi:hypothetical protein
MISAVLVERANEKLWRNPAPRTAALSPAENGFEFHRFSAAKPAGRTTSNCYTFEALAASRRNFLALYYHHYQKEILGFQEEEETWS